MPRNIRTPSNSGLILLQLQKSSNEPGEVFEQDRLTAHRIADLQLRHTQIAYLSACENKAVQLSAEVIHVVSGFQVAGFPHVVGLPMIWPRVRRGSETILLVGLTAELVGYGKQ